MSRRLAALLAGGLLYGAACRLPAAGVLSFCALAPLWACAAGAPPLRAALEGWLFGFCAWLAIGTPGFARTFSAFLSLPPEAGGIAFAAFCALQALLFALWAAAVSWTCVGLRREASARRFLLAVAFCALHFAVLEAVFPMLFPVRLASAVAALPCFAQTARLWGPGGLAFCAAFCSCALGAFAFDRRRAFPACVCAAALLAALCADGVLRLRALDRRPAAGEVSAHILQLGASSEGRELEESLRLSAEALREGVPGLMLWTEFDVFGDMGYGFEAQGGAHASLGGRPFREEVSRRLPVKAPLLFQAVGRGEDGRLRLLGVLKSSDGELGGLMEKTRLVPFGEFLPLEGLFPPLRRFSPRARRLSPGSERAPLSLPGLRVGALICYEDVFPSAARERVRRGASVLASMDSAGWFDPAGAELHLRQSALRAVETGRWLLRAVGGGSSMAVDPGGRVRARLERGRSGVLRLRVRPSLELTPYVRFGRWLEIFALFVSAAVLLARTIDTRGERW